MIISESNFEIPNFDRKIAEKVFDRTHKILNIKEKRSGYMKIPGVGPGSTIICFMFLLL